MTTLRRPSKQTLSVLALLAAAPRDWHYGLQLCRSTGLKSGSLYPILMRLSGRGLLESRWDAPAQPGLPPRHLYRLSAAGLAFAEEARSGEAKVRPRARLAGAQS